jgi:hypothetical protein
MTTSLSPGTILFSGLLHGLGPGLPLSNAMTRLGVWLAFSLISWPESSGAILAFPAGDTSYSDVSRATKYSL